MAPVFDPPTRRIIERAREVFTGRKVSSLSAEEAARSFRMGYQPDGEYLIGRDPRQMTRDELEAMGHEPMSPMEAIRAKCLDCCAGSSDEVRKCTAMACPSWPFRTGRNPWREVSEARREVGRRLAASRHGKSFEPKSDLSANDEQSPDDPEAADTGIRDRDHDFREDESELRQLPAAASNGAGC